MSTGLVTWSDYRHKCRVKATSPAIRCATCPITHSASRTLTFICEPRATWTSGACGNRPSSALINRGPRQLGRIYTTRPPCLGSNTSNTYSFRTRPSWFGRVWVACSSSRLTISHRSLNPRRRLSRPSSITCRPRRSPRRTWAHANSSSCLWSSRLCLSMSKKRPKSTVWPTRSWLSRSWPVRLLVSINTRSIQRWPSMRGKLSEKRIY